MNPAVGALTKALSRSLKAAGYYDESHPILTQIRKQSHEALQQACLGVPGLTLGSTGTKIVYDAGAPPLADSASAQLSEHLFARSIVALKFSRNAGPKDLGQLMLALAETPDKIRAAGGFSAHLKRFPLQGIEPVEVDFEALFSGKSGEVSDIGGGDPVVEAALKEVLQIKEKRKRAGDAIGVDIAGLTDPNSLGDFLDEMMANAEAGTVDESKGGPMQRPGGPGGKSSGVAAGKVKSRIGGGGNVKIEALNPDDLAELATKAYFGNQEYMQSVGTPESNLVESAKLMANVLSRLRPDARFVMLKKLASQTRADNMPSNAKLAGTKHLSQQVTDQAIVESITAILQGQGSDSDTVEAIAELMQQIRPIESERKRLLAELDVTVKKSGHSIDGVIWQEIQAKTLKSNGLGMLELAYRGTLDRLVGAAQERIQQTDGPPSVRQVYETLNPKMILGRFKDLWVGLVGKMPNPPDSLLASGTDLAKVLEVQGMKEASLQIAAFLLRQSERATPSSALHIQLKEFLAGADGIRRTLQIANAYECRGAVFAEAMLEALESPGVDAKTRELLLARFRKIDQAGLNAVAVQAQGAKPMRVFNLVRIGSAINLKTGVQLARLGLRNKEMLAKEMALKGLLDYPSSEMANLLFMAAGGSQNGDADSMKLLYLDPAAPDTEKKLRQIQTVAITVMGECRSPVTVQPLWYLLVRDSGFGKAHIEAARAAVAKALSANATPEARSALSAGLGSKVKGVKEACARYAKEAGL